MKILQIHNEYISYGGESVVVEKEKKILEDAGHIVTQYLLNNNVIKDYSFFDKVLFLINIFFSIDTYKKLSAYINQERPDIVHVHNVFPLLSPSVYTVCKKMKVPIVQTIHNFRFLCPNGLFYTRNGICEKCMKNNILYSIMYSCLKNSRILTLLYATSIGIHRFIGTFKKIDVYICLSEFMKLKMIEGGIAEEKIRVKPNFLLEKKTINESYPSEFVLFLGRLTKEKGIYTFLNAAKNLKHIPFVVAGTGDEEASVKDFIQFNSLENTKYVGFVSGEVKQRYLSNCICLVIPSEWYEPFGLNALEAYSYRKPVIATDLGSLPEVVLHKKTGLIYPSKNVKILCEHITCISEDENYRTFLGENGLKHFNMNFTEKQNYLFLDNIYNELLSF